MAIDPDHAEKTRDKILLHLKMRGPHTAADLARLFGVTGMAIRQHLATLQAGGLVEAEEERRPVGRPTRVWRLTERAAERFPSGYGDLAVEVLSAVREALGEAAVERVLEERVARQIAHYREQMPGAQSQLEARVARLVELRRAEGYLPEWTMDGKEACTLVENHCPVSRAAMACDGLCQSELRLFQEVLGPNVEVHRTEHLLDDSRRCAYRIVQRPDPTMV